MLKGNGGNDIVLGGAAADTLSRRRRQRPDLRRLRPWIGANPGGSVDATAAAAVNGNCLAPVHVHVGGHHRPPTPGPTRLHGGAGARHPPRPAGQRRDLRRRRRRRPDRRPQRRRSAATPATGSTAAPATTSSPATTPASSVGHVREPARLQLAGPLCTGRSSTATARSRSSRTSRRTRQSIRAMASFASGRSRSSTTALPQRPACGATTTSRAAPATT